MTKFKMLADGGFVAGDTVTGHTAYAYPSSPHATKARTSPEKVAAEMVRSANDSASSAYVDVQERFDLSNWAKLNA